MSESRIAVSGSTGRLGIDLPMVVTGPRSLAYPARPPAASATPTVAKTVTMTVNGLLMVVRSLSPRPQHRAHRRSRQTRAAGGALRSGENAQLVRVAQVRKCRLVVGVRRHVVVAQLRTGIARRLDEGAEDRVEPRRDHVVGEFPAAVAIRERRGKPA